MSSALGALVGLFDGRTEVDASFAEQCECDCEHEGDEPPFTFLGPKHKSKNKHVTVCHTNPVKKSISDTSFFTWQKSGNLWRLDPNYFFSKIFIFAFGLSICIEVD